MRISYSDEEETPGQFELWQANCRRSLAGRAGQRSLRELEAALVALPSKRLIAGALDDEDGDVCAIGALVKAKGITPEADPDYEMEDVGVECGMPRLVAWKVVEMNDVEFDTTQDVSQLPKWRRRALTPEERYEKVLAWVRRQVKV